MVPLPTPRFLRAHLGALVAIVVTGLVAVAGAAIVVLHPKQYVSTATLVMVDAPTIAEREFITHTTIDPSTRSWLARFDNTTVVADIYARKYRSPAKLDQLRARGVTGRLVVATKSTVASDTPDHGPVVVLAVFADGPAASQRQLDTVVADFRGQLAADQSGADPALTVTVATASVSDQAERVSGSRARSAFGFVALALLCGLLAVVAFSQVATLRRSRLAA